MGAESGEVGVNGLGVAVSETRCGNCGTVHDPDDIFCESCGYDFITGSMPGPAELDDSFQPGEVRLVRLEVAVDHDYFVTVVAEGELAFPDPVPEAQVLDLTGDEIHIGRTSASRAIHPDLDVADLTGDPAVSSRHAVLRYAPSGSLTVADVGSTNGTYIGTVESEAIAVGRPVTVAPGTPIYLGAWTRLTMLDGEAPS